MKTRTISVAPEREKETRSESKMDRESKKAVISTKRAEDSWIVMDSIKKLKQAFGPRRKNQINFQADQNGMSAILLFGGSMASSPWAEFILPSVPRAAFHPSHLSFKT